ncbi:MAG: ribose 5-phosphate isomerase B [Clostridia bacterium]|nr:ribose 5-phosphate isomerase B [Clostridia bacterium]
MKIAIGCDHGGIALKDACVKAIKDFGAEVVDFGTYDTQSVDYPDYAEKVALCVANGEADKGVLLCGTGIGISIAANKVKGIRCAHVTNKFCAQMSAEHNNANIIAMGGRISTPEEAYEMLTAFLSTPFAGGRHQKRVDKITAIEQKNL